MHRWFRRRTFLVVAPVASAVALLGFVGTAHTTASSSSTRLFSFSRPTPATTGRLTLRQAWDVALQAARVWSTQATIVQLQSIDGHGTAPPAPAQDDGSSSGWQAVLIAADKPDSELRVTIAGGAAVQAFTEPRRPSARDAIPRPTIDSPGALRLALATRPMLAPALDKGRGYGFVAQAGRSGKAILTVLGSYDGVPARVDLDGSSGQLIQASRYTWTAGGALYSADAGQTWHASNLVGGQVTGVAPVPGQAGRAFAVKPALDGVEIWESTDGGQLWAIRSRLPSTAGTWAYGLTAATLPPLQQFVLIVGTPNGLWISTDAGVSWQRNKSFPSGPPQWMSTSQGVDGETVLVTISAGQNAGLYASSNLGSWQKILDGVYRLSQTSGRRASVALADSRSTRAYLIVGRVAHPVQLSIPALRAAGQFAAAGVAVAEDPFALAVSKDGGLSWSTVLARPLTSLAASPNLAQDGVVVVAGPAQGIFRSGDAGRTWQHVLMSPKTVLPGSGWITQLSFVSPQHVIAVEGGIESWQSF